MKLPNGSIEWGFDEDSFHYARKSSEEYRLLQEAEKAQDKKARKVALYKHLLNLIENTKEKTFTVNLDTLPDNLLPLPKAMAYDFNSFEAHIFDGRILVVS